jgi:hypothetical protein
MTCQECEIKLGMGEDAGEHLASCWECRRLAGEVRLNSDALREMRVRPAMRWAWAMAAVAAAIVMAIGLWRFRPTEKPPQKAAAAKIGRPTRQEGSVVATAVPVKRAKPHPKRKRVPTETLRVKMFTSDPDVVIYWIVDKKEGYE